MEVLNAYCALQWCSVHFSDC